ncbi:MAG: M12 family metallopeptidase [Bryobacteraceae bacterium]
MRTNLGALAVCLLAGAVSAQSIQTTRSVEIDGKLVRYTVNGDLAVTQGDIILGTAAELEATAKNPAATPRSAAQYLAVPTWPGATLYYSIATGFPNPQRILDAVDHWNTNSPIKILPRVAESNYVQFVASSNSTFCASNIGMLGGRQTIQLGTSCPKGAIIHELGHALGLMHEQSRQDRNRWLTVLYENIDNTAYLQFGQESNSRDVGYYDYGSIMHYSPLGFSVDGNADLETVPGGIPIGQSVALSAGDIDNISRIYNIAPSVTRVTTIPTGLAFMVDGERYTAAQSFNWSAGSSHTISVDTTQNSGSAITPTRNSFVRWTDGGGPSHTFIASANQTVVAAEFQQNFKAQASSILGSGTVTLDPPSADGYYPAGSKVRITARPGSGYVFYRWAGTDPEAFGYGLAAESMTIELRGSVNFQGQFSNQFMTSIESNPPGADITIDGVPYYTPARFLSFTPGTAHTLGVTGPQQLTSDSRINFSGWEDGSLSTTRSITIPATAPVYAANFSKQYFLNYEYTNGGSVSVSPQAFDGFYDEGSRVALTAVPRGNQSLQYWLGDVANNGLTQDVVLDRAKYLFAVFGNPTNFRTTNAASYLSSPAFDLPGAAVAPLEIVTLFGTGLGPANLTLGALDQNGRLSTSVGSTRVLFNEFPAPIVYASDKQTSVIVPAEVAGKTFTVISIERSGTVTTVDTASVISSLPGLFTSNASGSGPVASFNQNGTLNSASAPAEIGSVVTLFATGAGTMDRSLPNGAVTDGNLLRPLLPVSVRIGTQTAEVLYAGSAPTLVHGVLQINVRIPANLVSGTYPIKLVVGDNISPPGTTVAVK